MSNVISFFRSSKKSNDHGLSSKSIERSTPDLDSSSDDDFQPALDYHLIDLHTKSFDFGHFMIQHSYTLAKK